MAKKYPQRNITGEELEILLNLKEEDIGRAKLQDLIGHRATNIDDKFVEIPPKYNTYDTMTIPVNRYAKNKDVIHTHVGKFIFFKFMFEEELDEFIPLSKYADADKYKSIDAGEVHNITLILSDALLQSKITSRQYVKYMNKLQWHFTIANFLNPSISAKSAKPLDEINQLKDKLFKKYSKQIEQGDTLISAKIEGELLSTAKEILKDDPGMDIYNSGANASFNNNYRAMFAMTGAARDNKTGEYNIVKSNLSDGMQKDELHTHFDSLVYGAYSKGVGVQVAGHMTKKFLAAYQSVTMDKKGTDCGTKISSDIVITKFNKGLFLYCYIRESNKQILLTGENIDKYLGKTVNIRLPMHCVNDKICNRCGGELPYLLDNKNIGLSTFVASGSLLRKSMKKFHDKTIKVTKLSIDDLIM